MFHVYCELGFGTGLSASWKAAHQARAVLQTSLVRTRPSKNKKRRSAFLLACASSSFRSEGTTAA
eukprot:scaffold53_cov193-Pinguiococcus_pyrenoidosus.AAC.49